MEVCEIEAAVKKLQYQVAMIGETIDREAYPVQGLILDFDWSQTEVTKAHGVFKAYDEEIKSDGAINRLQFEERFERELGLNYQGLKSVILAFWRNGQWTNVCEAYVRSLGNNVSVEYSEIMRAIGSKG